MIGEIEVIFVFTMMKLLALAEAELSSEKM